MKYFVGLALGIVLYCSLLTIYIYTTKETIAQQTIQAAPKEDPPTTLFKVTHTTHEPGINGYYISKVYWTNQVHYENDGWAKFNLTNGKFVAVSGGFITVEEQ
jgi:hypothetical protein